MKKILGNDLPTGLIIYTPAHENEKEKWVEAKFGIDFMREGLVDFETDWHQFYHYRKFELRESVPGTILFLGPTKRFVCIRGVELSVEHLNRCVKASYQLDVMYAQWKFTGTALGSVAHLAGLLKTPMVAFETAQKANPELFEDVKDEFLMGDVKKSVAHMGTFVDQLELSQKKLLQGINEHIKLLNSLGVVWVDDRGSGTVLENMNWAIEYYSEHGWPSA